MSSIPSNTPLSTKPSKILDFATFKSKQDVNSEFSRARKPLFVNPDQGQISGSVDGLKSTATQDDFGDRLQKIRSSLERINTLMADLKKLSSGREKDQIQ